MRRWRRPGCPYLFWGPAHDTRELFDGVKPSRVANGAQKEVATKGAQDQNFEVGLTSSPNTGDRIRSGGGQQDVCRRPKKVIHRYLPLGVPA